MTSIYLAEDSPITSYFLRRLLDGAPDLTVVGVGRDGRQAMEDLERLRPDILVTDLVMPEMDGFELIRWVMATRPIPVLVLSDTIDSRSSDQVMRCLELGAMEARAKPKLDSQRDSAVAREGFQGLLRALSKVKPLGRNPAYGAAPLPVTRTQVGGRRPDFLLIGASTGGPQAVVELLKKLGPGFPLPAFLALHMEPGFMEGLGRWIQGATGWNVDAKADGSPSRPGTLYLPPEGRHLQLDPQGCPRSALASPKDMLVPSVDQLFLSALPLATRVAAVLLTGMGRDGAVGLLALREGGAQTMAQDEAGCAVFGMPRAAIELQAAATVLSLGGMADRLSALAGSGGAS